MMLNLLLSLAATGGYIIQSSSSKGRQGRLPLGPIGTIIAIAAIIAAFVLITWWWVLIGIVVMAIVTGTMLAIFRDNSIFIGIGMILASAILLVVYLVR